MSVFRDLIDTRARLTEAVDAVLASIEAGQAPERLEREIVDCKEEAGRRGRDGILLPGEAHNQLAAEKLAREVCCLANTPGGGALIVGIEDGSWQVLGTNLDNEWLRHRVYQLVEIAPAVEERVLSLGRVLVLYVAEAREPVEDQDGKIRWRVESNCEPVDRSEWWRHREQRAGLDTMAAATIHTAADSRAGALQTARRYLAEADDHDVAEAASDEALLRRLGVLRSDGYLTQAGSLLFCAAGRPLLTLTRFDVNGGDVIGTYEGDPELSLIEQLREVETRLDAINASSTVSHGFVEESVRVLPVRVVREAILNGVVHRDWIEHEPTRVVWIDIDDRLEVTSPGGFPGEITEQNVLTQREARYPALSDAFRALRLVDKQGVGVPRMYREMIAIGHRPPEIIEIAGPRVRCLLQGGAPVIPIVTLISSIAPEARQRDVRVALLVHTLLYQPFVTVPDAAHILQTSEPDAVGALEGAAEARVDGEPLLRVHQDAWLLGESAIRRVTDAMRSGPAQARGILPYRKPKPEGARVVIEAWLARHDRITSRDFAVITGIATPNATRTLNGYLGDLLERGDQTRGRGAHFRRRQRPDREAPTEQTK